MKSTDGITTRTRDLVLDRLAGFEAEGVAATQLDRVWLLILQNMTEPALSDSHGVTVASVLQGSAQRIY